MVRIPKWRRYARIFGPDPAADVDDELRFHIDTKVDELIAQGWKWEEARREAERLFGDLKTVRHTGELMRKERDRNMQRRDSGARARRIFAMPCVPCAKIAGSPSSQS